MILRVLKSLLARLLFVTRLYRLILRNTGFAVVFHSVVRDEPASALRCPAGDFERICGFLRRYFRTVTLAQIGAAVRARTGPGGCASITFDDGYADNAQVAAPILRSMGLPATFFVVTGFIGSERQAPWDEKRGFRSRWMNWDEVRGLAEQGFEIGAHSTSHQDMGGISCEAFEADLIAARGTMLQHLNRAPVGFAYPFGSPRHVNSHAPQVLQRQGFEYCVLADGGLIGGHSDPMALPRIPINALEYADAYVLGFEILYATLLGRWHRHEPVAGAGT